MTTDPVPHTCSPNFNTELAWAVDRKGLHQHKLRRTPVKLQCYAIDRQSGKKESVGYIVLEIRSAQDSVRVLAESLLMHLTNTLLNLDKL